MNDRKGERRSSRSGGVKEERNKKERREGGLRRKKGGGSGSLRNLRAFQSRSKVVISSSVPQDISLFGRAELKGGEPRDKEGEEEK